MRLTSFVWSDSVRRTLTLVALLCTSCNGHQGTATEDAGSQETSDGDVDSTESSGTEGPAPDLGGETDGETGEDPVDALWPMAAGNWWSYDGGLYCSLELTQTVVQETDVDGHPAFAFNPDIDCPGEPWILRKEGLDRVLFWVDAEQAWAVVYDEPVEEGHEWDVSVGSRRWEWVGEYSVPAGDFDACWSAVTEDSMAIELERTVWCRAVGKVAYDDWEFDVHGKLVDFELFQ
jgi:hypothetical protein